MISNAFKFRAPGWRTLKKENIVSSPRDCRVSWAEGERRYRRKSADLVFHLPRPMERNCWIPQPEFRLLGATRLLWRNCRSWPDVEKPSLAYRGIISLRLLFGRKSAW